MGPIIEIEDTVEKLEDIPSNNVQDVVDLTKDNDDHLMNIAQLSGQITAQYVVDLTKDDDNDLMNSVQPRVEVKDQSGSGVASSSQTVGDDAGLIYVPGRMRGFLSGQAYDGYYNQMITWPMQQVEAARSMLGITLPVQPQFIAGGVHHNPTRTMLTRHRFGRPLVAILPSTGSNSSRMQ